MKESSVSPLPMTVEMPVGTVTTEISAEIGYHDRDAANRTSETKENLKAHLFG